MIKTPFICLLLSLFCTCVHAQAAYFQQSLDYQIEARLDDTKHVLHAHLKLRYRNNSSDTLREIPFHVWPRAYSTDRSAFARQQLRNGDTRFHFSEPDQRGTLDSLDFSVAGQAGSIKETADPDVIRVQLPRPLLPGDEITIETPFRVKIPASFSRLGHVGESYQMTQWYPKPAVYDRNGWHEMPYLDQGEFYSEFGNFTVRLTLPENYRVGATGHLQEPSERQWLLRKAAENRAGLAQRTDLSEGFVAEPFPASSPTTKTISWRAEQVHDFAWFADKRFKVLHDTLLMGARTQDAMNGIEQPGIVDVWAFFTETEADLWKDATDYLKRATRFYSNHIGRYPYPQVTGVQSALSAGGGMEYPMITVIGRNFSAADLDEVLTHEVGHNWFYGILASNERNHPWMDEGLNSYYEHRYMAKYYPDLQGELPIVGTIDYDRLGYHLAARLGRDQPPNTRSDSLSQINYWIGAYSKPSLALQELAPRLYLKEAELDDMMRAYYNTWKFKHPQPEDFFAAMADNQSTFRPEEFRSWFPVAFMTNATSDYRATGEGMSVAGNTNPAFPEVKHRGGRKPPVIYSRHPEKAGYMISNPLDLWTTNNTNGKRLAKPGFGTAQEEPGYQQGFLLPLLGYNLNDGIQLGAALHNRTLEPRRFEWMLAPMYGFGSQELTGFAGLQYRMPRPFDGAQRLVFGFGTQRFSDFTLTRTEETYAYQRTALRATLTFDHPPITERESELTLQLLNLAQDRPVFAGDTLPSGTQTQGNVFIRAGYTRRLQREINPRGYAFRLEYKNRDGDRSEAFEASHLRLEAEITGGYQYEQDRFFRWRLFGGYFLSNDLRESAFKPANAFSLVDNAAADYRYDGLFAGRGAPVGSWAEQQIGRQQGGFRAPISPAFGFGRSNSYLTALNIDADLPLDKLPLTAFFDAGFYGAKATGNDPISGNFNWVGGLGLTTLDGQVGIYFPLLADPDTRELLEQRGNLLDRISVRLNLSGFMPWRWVDGLF